MTEKILSLAAMEKLLKKAGAGRVSQDSLIAMRDLMEDYGIKVAKKSIKLAEHAGRKTVKADDVKLAHKE